VGGGAAAHGRYEAITDERLAEVVTHYRAELSVAACSRIASSLAAYANA
jgi:hypothetical protein